MHSKLEKWTREHASSLRESAVATKSSTTPDSSIQQLVDALIAEELTLDTAIRDLDISYEDIRSAVLTLHKSRAHRHRWTEAQQMLMGEYTMELARLKRGLEVISVSEGILREISEARQVVEDRAIDVDEAKVKLRRRKRDGASEEVLRLMEEEIEGLMMMSPHMFMLFLSDA